MHGTVKVVEIDPVKEKLIERFAERLKEAYPQSDRNNPDPMICYGDFCDIVDEVATEITDSIANGVTVQEWISVKDRLPEPGERVLVCIGAVFEAFIDDAGKWQRYYSAPLNEVLGEPTHWMPLPQPPKGE